VFDQMEERPLSAVDIGVTRAEEIVYLELCRLGSATTDDLAAVLGLEQALVLQVLAGLRAKWLVRPPESGAPSQWTAAAPDVALERVLFEREREERLLHEGITRLLEGYHRKRGQRDPQAADLVEVVTGRETIAETWLSMLTGAREVVAVLDKPPFVQIDDVGPELEVLGRGIEVRSVYERASLLVPGQLAQVQSLVTAGESAVMVAEVPFKLALVDRRWALLPVAPGTELSGALIVRPSPLLDALIQTFESQWTRGMPVPGSGRRAVQGAAQFHQGHGHGHGAPEARGGAVDPADPEGAFDAGTKELLTLLTAGMTDDGIARQLGVSARTVQRRVSELMESLGARNRFQAGVQAVRRGLL
jgi:DNA-binding CsgD family transcriptional regulator